MRKQTFIPGIPISHFDRLRHVLADANGPNTAHTASVESIVRAALQIDAHCRLIDIPIFSWIGAQAALRTAGFAGGTEMVVGNRVAMRRGIEGWSVTSISQVLRKPADVECIDLVLTERQYAMQLRALEKSNG